MNGRIGLDIRMIRHTGIGTYISGLLSGFQKNVWSGLTRLRLYGDPALLPEGPGLDAVRFRSPIYSLREQGEYPSHLRNCVLWHSPHYNIPLLRGRTKLVVTIHDLIHWVFRREYFSRLQAAYAGWMLRSAVCGAAHIITVSEHTKADLIKYFNARPERITVIHEGVDPDFRPPDPESESAVTIARKYRVPADYFLYVGSLKPHKNVKLLIETYRRLKREKRVEAGLVIIGKKDRRYPPGFETVAALDSGGGITYLPFVDRADLPAIYGRALALVHPSLYEGFGLTLLEAMACGTPVITSRAASLPEVAGQAAVLFDPRSAAELEAAMVRIAGDAKLRESLREKGKTNVRRFSWEDAANQTARIYENVLGES